MHEHMIPKFHFACASPASPNASAGHGFPQHHPAPSILVCLGLCFIPFHPTPPHRRCSASAIWSLSDLRVPARQATLRGHRGSLRSVAFFSRAQPTTIVGGAADVGAGPEPGGGAGASGGGRGNEAAVSRMVITTGTDATVRVWSYQEAVRRRELSYICPWALTG